MPNFDEPGYFLDPGSEEYLLAVCEVRDYTFQRWEKSGFSDDQLYNSYLAWHRLAERLKQ